MAETREEKHLQRLKELYAAGRFAPNKLDQQGLCHIHHAVYRGYLLCAKWLYKHGSSLTVRSAEGSVPAHYAAAGGHLECLRWIYRKSSKSISMTDNNGATPLYFAAQEGRKTCLEWLAKHSGTVHWETSVDGMTAAHAAALEGHLECLAFLLGSAGCSALARDRAANTPLHYAAACGRRPCVEWLLGNTGITGNERNKLGSSPLHLATQDGHLEVVKLLVRRGVAIKSRDRMGRTPFTVAVESGNEACAQFLYQTETNSIDMVSGPVSGKHSAKRVRFERKAIERDSDLAQAHSLKHVTHSDALSNIEHMTRKPYSLYRNTAEGAVPVNRPSSATVETGSAPQARRGRSQMDRKHAIRETQASNTSFEDLQTKSHVTSARLLPWSRVYRMKQTSEATPSPHQAKIYGSYSLSETNGRGTVPPEKNPFVSSHYASKSYENPSKVTRSSSFLSRFVSKRKDEELFPAQVDPFDDVVNNHSQGSNVFKRLYRFSKEKVTKSSSFAIESLEDTANPWQKRDSIVVSGNDDFIYRPTKNVVIDKVLQVEKGETFHRENDKGEFSSARIPGEMHLMDDCSKSERNQLKLNPAEPSSGKKIRERFAAKETRTLNSSPENSMIW